MTSMDRLGNAAAFGLRSGFNRRVARYCNYLRIAIISGITGIPSSSSSIAEDPLPPSTSPGWVPPERAHGDFWVLTLSPASRAQPNNCPAALGAGVRSP